MKGSRGSAVLEFAIVVPVLLLLLIGIIEVCLMTYDEAIINMVSREGARYGTIYRGTSFATLDATKKYTENLLNNYLVSFSSASPVSVTVTSSNSSPKSGDELTVTVSYTYTGLLLYVLIGQPKMQTFSSTTTMSYE